MPNPRCLINKGHRSRVGLKGRQSGLRRRRRGMKKDPAPWLSSLKYNNVHGSWQKNGRRTISGEPAGHASTSRTLEPDLGADANVGTTPDVPPTEDADRLSATNSEVESAMNHRRRRATLRDLISLKRRSMPSIQGTRTSELLKMVLPEPRTSM